MINIYYKRYNNLRFNSFGFNNRSKVFKYLLRFNIKNKFARFYTKFIIIENIITSFILKSIYYKRARKKASNIIGPNEEEGLYYP